MWILLRFKGKNHTNSFIRSAEYWKTIQIPLKRRREVKKLHFCVKYGFASEKSIKFVKKHGEGGEIIQIPLQGGKGSKKF